MHPASGRDVASPGLDTPPLRQLPRLRIQVDNASWEDSASCLPDRTHVSQQCWQSREAAQRKDAASAVERIVSAAAVITGEAPSQVMDVRLFSHSSGTIIASCSCRNHAPVDLHMHS